MVKYHPGSLQGIMVDMEEGVINQIRRSPLNELFDDDQSITSVSGSGNNWGVGHHVYGPLYHEQILETIRRQAEYCDSLQSFFMMLSLGGGTGSGLGSYIVRLLRDEFPRVHSFVAAIVPSPTDDVVTSPYNSMLSLHQMQQHADCVLPIDNLSLGGIYERIHSKSDVGSLARKRGSALTDSSVLTQPGIFRPAVMRPKAEPFDTMNNIVANLLLNMTSSMRFEGTLNVDINDIVTNLIPFPRLKYLFSSMTPLYSLTDIRVLPRRQVALEHYAFASESQLVSADPKSSIYLASALIVRGDVEISDLRRNIERMRKTLRFVKWNTEGWKTGLCDVPPIGQVFGRISERFNKLYRRRANIHHYLENMEIQEFEAARESLRSTIQEYVRVETGSQ
eukprot:jgi/Hompol1/5120/HPOL_000431-RA